MRRSRRVPGAKNPREFCTVRGENGPDWDIPNNDIKSVSHAILERVFFVKSGGGFQRAPKPADYYRRQGDDDPELMGSKHVEMKLQRFSREMEILAESSDKVSPITTKQFVDSYGGAKHRAYAAAGLSLEEQPLTTRDFKVKTFTKDDYRKPGAAPRAIQPRSPRFNVQLGRYVKPLEHTIFESIDKIFDPSGVSRTVAKGMNMNERGARVKEMWDKYENPVAVGLDASRFDQHINLDLLDFEHKIYQMWCVKKGIDIPSLKYLLKQQRVNRGTYRSPEGRVDYKVFGCRMSGDMNTSLGNVTIMCGLMYAYFEEKKLLGKISLLNDGDDCVIIMDKRNLAWFQKDMEDWFLRVGITMCYDGIYTALEAVEFCQAHPVFDEEVGYRLVPRPTKRLYSDLVTTKKIGSKKVYKKWLGAVAGCGQAMSSGLPIFQSFYHWVGRGATPYIPEQGSVYHKYRQELTDRMIPRTREPSMAERISFYFAFDVTPDEQKMVENYYSQLPDPIHQQAEEGLVQTIDPIQHLVHPEQKNRY